MRRVPGTRQCHQMFIVPLSSRLKLPVNHQPKRFLRTGHTGTELEHTGQTRVSGVYHERHYLFDI